MNDWNPYAPPKADVQQALASDQPIWRDGQRVVFHRHAQHFPPRCIRCGQPGSGALRRSKLIWTPRYLYITFYIALITLFVAAGLSRNAVAAVVVLLAASVMLLAAIAGFAVRKVFRPYVALCTRHQQALLIGRCIAVAGAVILPLLTLVLRGELFLVPFALFWVWILAAYLTNRPLLRSARIEGDMVSATGCAQGFLKTLPGYNRPGV